MSSNITDADLTMNIKGWLILPSINLNLAEAYKDPHNTRESKRKEKRKKELTRALQLTLATNYIVAVKSVHDIIVQHINTAKVYLYRINSVLLSTEERHGDL